MKRLLFLLFLALPAEAQYQHLRYDYNRSANAQMEAIPLQVALKAVASSTFSGTLSSGSFKAPDAGCYRWTTDSFICRYAAGQVSITKDGTGLTTNTGWNLGYSGTSGYATMVSSSFGTMGLNAGFQMGPNGEMYVRGGASGSVNLGINGGDYLTIASNSNITINGGTGGVYGWNSDTAFSRISAGVIGVGTGAAGSTAGTLRAKVLGTPTGYAIASLPAAVAGDRTFVTDQITACAAIGIAPTSGGALVCPVFYNGTAWVGG